MVEHVLGMSEKVLLVQGRQQVMKGNGKDSTHRLLQSCEGGADGAGNTGRLESGMAGGRKGKGMAFRLC